jgi:hypothetical protein
LEEFGARSAAEAGQSRLQGNAAVETDNRRIG